MDEGGRECVEGDEWRYLGEEGMMSVGYGVWVRRVEGIRREDTYHSSFPCKADIEASLKHLERSICNLGAGAGEDVL